MPRILSLYIVRETLVPFLLTLFVLTITALLGKVIELTGLFLSNDISASGVFWLIVGAIPPLLYYTVPMAYLIGVLIGFARLSADSEITAVKSGGIGLMPLLKPVLCTAFAACLVMLYIANYAAPKSHALLYKVVFEAGKANAARAIDERTFYDRFTGLTVYVDRVSEAQGQVEGVFISGDITGEGNAVMSAEKGLFVEDGSGESIVLILENGVVRRLSSDGRADVISFEKYELQLPLGASLTGNYKRTNNKELFYSELVRKKKDMIEAGLGNKADQAELEIHERFAMPVSVLLFALIGVPLGIQKARSAKFSGFGLAITVLLAYFVAQKGFETAVVSGGIPAPVGAWGANTLLLAATIYMLAGSVKEKQVVNVARIEEFLIACWSRITSRIGIKA